MFLVGTNVWTTRGEVVWSKASKKLPISQVLFTRLTYKFMQIRLTDYNCNITINNNNNCYLIFENLFHFKAHLGFFFLPIAYNSLQKLLN